MKVHQGVAHNHGIVGSGEGLYQRFSESQDHNQEQGRPDEAEDGRFPDTVPDPVHTACAEVLADESSVGTGDAGKRHVSNHDDSTGCRVGGDDGGSQRIDGALQDDGADGENGVHQAHGKTGGDKLAHEFLIIGKMSSGRNQKTEIPVEIQKAEHTGDQLGQNGRSCDSGHTETEDGHGKKIQKKVKAAGEDQEIQRDLAVSHGS